MFDGAILGVITWASMVFTFMHLPRFIKRFLLRHFIISDIIATGITFFLLSSISHSIMAVVGSITCGLLVHISLMAVNKFQLGDSNAKQTASSL